MATPVMMPKVGISVESCILTEWHKKKGDAVKVGDLLFTYETDKSTIDETSEAEGILLEQFAKEGDDVPVMTNVCVIGQEGESTAEFAPAKEEEPEEAAEEAPAAAPDTTAANVQAAPSAAASGDGFVKASPRAKHLAEKTGTDLRYAAPTGAEGRVIERDVRTLLEKGPAATYAASGAFAGAGGTGIGGRFAVADIGTAPAAAPVAAEAAPEYTDEKMSGIRKAIAKSMTLSLTTIPQLTHTLTFDATEIMALRKKLKANAEKLSLNNITLNDIVLFAVSRVLAKEEHRALNAHYIGNDMMRFFKGVHLGIAVDTPRGLMVPTIRNADQKSLNEIAGEAKALAASCQQGNINPDLLTGASFTVSNVGSFGVESFTPVINPPQTGILGVDTITTRVRESDGALKAYPAMGLSLTYDHRAVDGAPASKFLAELKSVLENFSAALCK